VWNRRRVVYYAILILLILGELLGERNYIIIIFRNMTLMTKSVKGIELEFASAPIGAVTGMERDLIRKVVQQPTSWAYLRVE